MKSKSSFLILVLIGLLIPINGINNKSGFSEYRYKIESFKTHAPEHPTILLGNEVNHSNEKINDFLHNYRYQIAGFGLLMIIGFFMNLIKGKDRRKRR